MILTRRERVRLLLRTLKDALGESPGQEAGGRTALDSRALGHGPIYQYGSYRDLERCLADLKAKAPGVYWHTIAVYVEKHPKARKAKAELGVDYLVKHMPANLFISPELVENAGFMASEARKAARPRSAA